MLSEEDFQNVHQSDLNLESDDLRSSGAFQAGDDRIISREIISSQHGRTGWDLLYSVRYILAVAGIIGFAVFLMLVDVISVEELFGFLSEFIPLGIIAFGLGAYFADNILKRLYQTRYRFVLTISKNDVVSLKAIPEPVFRYFNQTGNNYVLMSVCGTPVYLANDIDLQHGIIDYGWAHMDKWECVATDRKMFREWKKQHIQNLLRNLELERFLTGKTLEKVLKAVNASLNDIEQCYRMAEKELTVKEPVVENIQGDAESVPSQ